MDLLGSILGSMEKPPAVDDDAKKKLKEQKAKMEKFQARERLVRASFRKEIQTRLNRFVQNDAELECFRFEPMDKVRRSIVHEVAEVAGLASAAFGIEDVDRFVMIFKKEKAPTEEELVVYRSGQTYDPKEVREILQRRQREKQEREDEESRRKSAKNEAKPTTDYHNKYQHLIGVESAAAAAQSLHANSAYGFVSSENKKDKRSIEETLADIRSKKRQRTDVSGEDLESGEKQPGGESALEATTEVADVAEKDQNTDAV